MTATFWTGSSLSFTNGSKTVTVNTGPSLDSVKANSSLTAGNYNEPVEVKSASGNTITLYNNWPGSTGTTSATIKPSAAAAASAGVAAQQLITDIQSLVSSASATATANSFVKRDSNGRIKAASPSANDDVVSKGYLGSAATKNVGYSNGQIMENGAWGTGLLVGEGIKNSEHSIVNDLNESSQPSQFFVYDSNTLNKPSTPKGAVIANGIGISISRTSDIWGQLTLSRALGSVGTLITRVKDGTNVVERLVYDSGNTNFNELGGNGSGDGIAVGYMATGGTARFFVPINSKTPPSSITTSGSFSVREINTVINTNITSVTLSGGSSNKIGLLEVTGLTGTAGNPVVLQIENASSSIAFNF
ncbi:MAG: hypothetical protein CMK64_10355 [Pseudoalteromonas sp.]|nr:hypothetical protein [Pseudoalteromonas sp.]|tara:strand:+ start:4136 stop:5218 length:1083 start_codon:yes stop_codon:yes gene_type:complete